MPPPTGRGSPTASRPTRAGRLGRAVARPPAARRREGAATHASMALSPAAPQPRARRRRRRPRRSARPTPRSTRRSPPHRKFAFTAGAARRREAGQERARRHGQRRRARAVRRARCAVSSTAHGETPDADLVAMVPISVRTEDQQGTMGNQVSGMLTSLATDSRRPGRAAARHPVGHQATPRSRTRPSAPSTLTDWAEFAAPAVAARAARLYSRMKLADRVTADLQRHDLERPRSRLPALLGRRPHGSAMYPMGPITDGAALNITVISYMGQCLRPRRLPRDGARPLGARPRHRDALDELKKAADRA